MTAISTKVDDRLKKELITTLLKVYMSGRYELFGFRRKFDAHHRSSEPSVSKASRLLNTQAMNLDALEVPKLSALRI